MSKEIPIRTKRNTPGEITNIQLLMNIGVPISRIARGERAPTRQTIHTWINTGVLTKA